MSNKKLTWSHEPDSKFWYSKPNNEYQIYLDVKFKIYHCWKLEDYNYKLLPLYGKSLTSAKQICDEHNENLHNNIH